VWIFDGTPSVDEAPRSPVNNTGIGEKENTMRDEKQETLPRRHEKRVEVFVFCLFFSSLSTPSPRKIGLNFLMQS